MLKAFCSVQENIHIDHPGLIERSKLFYGVKLISNMVLFVCNTYGPKTTLKMERLDNLMNSCKGRRRECNIICNNRKISKKEHQNNHIRGMSQLITDNAHILKTTGLNTLKFGLGILHLHV